MVCTASVCTGQAAEAATTPGKDLRMPEAEFAEPDDFPPEVRPVVDILQDGRVLCGGKVWYDPAKDGGDTRPMDALLAELKARPETTTKEERIGDRKIQLVDDPLLIRADRWTEWHHVGEFMTRCSQPAAAFWKIELGVTVPGGEAAKIPSYLPRDQGGGAPAEHLTVEIVCSQWGKQVPRRPQDGAGAEAGDAAKVPFDLEGHGIVWQVGPKKIGTEEALLDELKRIHDDRTTWQGDAATGDFAPMPVVIRPQKGATYGDAVRTVDAVRKAGFAEIHFGGGRGARAR